MPELILQIQKIQNTNILFQDSLRDTLKICINKPCLNHTTINYHWFTDLKLCIWIFQRGWTKVNPSIPEWTVVHTVTSGGYLKLYDNFPIIDIYFHFLQFVAFISEILTRLSDWVIIPIACVQFVHIQVHVIIIDMLWSHSGTVKERWNSTNLWGFSSWQPSPKSLSWGDQSILKIENSLLVWNQFHSMGHALKVNDCDGFFVIFYVYHVLK